MFCICFMLSVLCIMYTSPQLSAVTMKDLDPKKPAKYADSSISDKAFKNMIIWFAIYCGLFCLGVIFVIGADKNYLS